MIVGLTGGIGSGKSFVASIFEKLGVPVYNSDVRAKFIMHHDNSVKQQIINLLGNEAYINDNLNRSWIAAQVFTNKNKLKALNAIVHPAVAADVKAWYTSQNSSFVLQESALLFENGTAAQFDKIILVTAPLETRIQRVLQRDDTTEKVVLNRMNNQWSDAQKIPLADYIIDNIDKADTELKVNHLYETLMKLS